MSNISNIEEIPLEAEPQLNKEEQDIRENEEENENIQENIEPVEENIQPKRGRGRPAGAKNKAKAPPPPKPKPVAPKPKAKRKQPEPVYEDDSSEDDYYQASAPHLTHESHHGIQPANWLNWEAGMAWGIPDCNG